MHGLTKLKFMKK